jgi:hypothetical protein
MSVHQPLRQHNLQAARNLINEQLAEIEEDTLELIGSQLTKPELRDFEIENDRHLTIINGYEPYEGYRYDTLDQYNQALESLVWHVTEAEKVIIESVRRRICEDEAWRNIWLGEYYEDLRVDQGYNLTN